MGGGVLGDREMGGGVLGEGTASPSPPTRGLAGAL